MKDPSLRGFSTTGGLTFSILTIIFLFLSIVAFVLRIWAKTMIRRQYQAHDYLISMALVRSRNAH